MSEFFINPRMQPYSYLKTRLRLGRNALSKFDVLNAHLVNGAVLPGEIIVLGDNSTPNCTAEEAFYMNKAAQVHLALMFNGMQGDGFLVDNHELLRKLTGYTAIGIGAVGGAWSNHLDGIQKTLEEIEAAHRDHLRRGATQDRKAFIAKRDVLFKQLDGQLNGFARYGSGLRNQGSIKKMLGISTQSYLRTGEITGYADTINRVAKASKLMKSGTYIGVALDVAAKGTAIHAACSTGREEQCRKAKFVEGGKLSLGLAGGAWGGAIGGSVAMVGCMVVFGVPTGGAGALVCAVIGGGVGGWVGGEMGEFTGELAGELIYEHTLP